MGQILTGGNLAEKILRNRGRSRALVAKVNLWLVQRRFERFIKGKWRPVIPDVESDYAISLTSWSQRIGHLQLTLMTLIDQDVRPAGIHVWLTEPDCGMIPAANREAFEAHGVRFRMCPDYRSHKKWLPMMLSGHNKPFVVCDDDIFYPREWFRQLVSEDREDAYVGCKCHRMVEGCEGLPAPYSEWEKQVYHVAHQSLELFTTGCGGVILHPDRISQKALDWEAIRKHALFSDDIWLKAAHLATGIPVHKTLCNFPCLELPGTDQSGLLANHNTSQNDEQIAAVWSFFGIKGFKGKSS